MYTLTAGLAAFQAPVLPSTTARCGAVVCVADHAAAMDRRAVLGGLVGAAAALATPAPPMALSRRREGCAAQADAAEGAPGAIV